MPWQKMRQDILSNLIHLKDHLLKSRNNRGPRIKPCGTPHLSLVKSDETFLFLYIEFYYLGVILS